MQLTNGQSRAIEAIVSLHLKFPYGGGIVVIDGPAGTGKTTLIRELAEFYGDGFFVLAPTGKAASRVKDLSDCDAMTIHRWMYSPVEDKNGDVRFELKDSENIRRPLGGCIIIDEASMVTHDTFADIYSYCFANQLNLVLVGDGFQLPPVEMEPTKRNFSVFNPEFVSGDKVTSIKLDEIVRQAAENPIISVGSILRTSSNTMEIVQAMSVFGMVDRAVMLDEATTQNRMGGMVICHTNETRKKINDFVGGTLDLDQCGGDSVLVTKNNYTLDVFNGEKLERIGNPKHITKLNVYNRFKNVSTKMDFYSQDLLSGNGIVRAIISPQSLSEQFPELNFKLCTKALKGYKDRNDPDGDLNPEEYVEVVKPYALTCHKSQGSEAESVFVVLEKTVRLGTPEGRRWTYTAITRSRDCVKITYL